jgi:hypothetical protein
MSPDTLIDERFDEIVAALRAETPSTPDALRERVAAVTTTRPLQPRFSARRAFALALPVAITASLAVALAVGLNTAARPGAGGGSGDRGTAAPSESPHSAPERTPPATGARDEPETTTLTPRAERAGGAALSPSRRRAQDYTANLRLLVDGTDSLSATTQRALRTTSRLGGYVVAVEYRTPEPGEGTATVRLRIPVSRVQAAIVEFSALGRILAQETRIADLQQPLDDLARRIRRLERRASRTTGAERARILAEITRLRGQRAKLTGRAAFARVNLDLTTHAPEQPEATPGRFERAIDDAAGVLTAELAIGAYLLIVASPLLVLLIAAVFANRAYRRYADQRLLERA